MDDNLKNLLDVMSKLIVKLSLESNNVTIGDMDLLQDAMLGVGISLGEETSEDT